MKFNIPLVANTAKLARQELEVLSREALESELSTLNNVLPKPYWSISETTIKSQLEASYTLKNYLKTWQFLNLVAANAHKLKHHPTITTTYNKVHIALTTHDAGNKVTYLDTKLATAIHNAYAGEFAQPSSNSSGTVPTFTMNRAFKVIDELTKRD